MRKMALNMQHIRQMQSKSLRALHNGGKVSITPGQFNTLQKAVDMLKNTGEGLTEEEKQFIIKLGLKL